MTNTKKKRVGTGGRPVVVAQWTACNIGLSAANVEYLDRLRSMATVARKKGEGIMTRSELLRSLLTALESASDDGDMADAAIAHFRG